MGFTAINGGVREGKGQEMNWVLQQLTVESVKENDKKMDWVSRRLTVESVREKDKKWIEFYSN
jgi:hypothetical protein